MTRRQTLPDRWFLVTGSEGLDVLRALPKDCGLILLPELPPRVKADLTRLARMRKLILLEERAGAEFRVHNMRELRRALGGKALIILISPIHPTRSHPNWPALPRMRAATLARLANRRAIALGGMNAQRYANIAPLGFIGWAGISGFRT